MNTSFWLLFLIVTSLSTSQQTPRLPTPVESGLQAYQTSGATAAVRSWLADSPLASQRDLLNKTVAEFKAIEQTYGAFSSYEVLGIKSFGQRSLRCYLVLQYEKGPVFIYFDSYRTAKRWTVTGFLFNTKADLILSSGFFEVH